MGGIFSSDSYDNDYEMVIRHSKNLEHILQKELLRRKKITIYQRQSFSELIGRVEELRLFPESTIRDLRYIARGETPHDAMISGTVIFHVTRRTVTHSAVSPSTARNKLVYEISCTGLDDRREFEDTYRRLNRKFEEHLTGVIVLDEQTKCFLVIGCIVLLIILVTLQPVLFFIFIASGFAVFILKEVEAPKRL